MHAASESFESDARRVAAQLDKRRPAPPPPASPARVLKRPPVIERERINFDTPVHADPRTIPGAVNVSAEAQLPR